MRHILQKPHNFLHNPYKQPIITGITIRGEKTNTNPHKQTNPTHRG